MYKMIRNSPEVSEALEHKKYSIQKGKLIIEPAAFQDRYKQPYQKAGVYRLENEH